MIEDVQGIEEFAVEPPVIITDDNYEQLAGHPFSDPDLCKVNI